MKKLLKRLSVDFIEPTNMFEQLEERVVLDATIAQIDTNPAQSGGNVTVQQDHTVTADAQANDEGLPGFNYDLQVNGTDVAAYNAGNPVGAADIALDPSFAQNGQFSWTPNNLDVGVVTFKVISHDDATSTSDEQSFTVTVDNIAPTITSAATHTFTEDQPNQTFNITVDPSTDIGKGLTFSIVNETPALGSWFHLDPDTGTITVDNPSDAAKGTYILDIKADDGHASSTQLGFQLVIQNQLDITTANSHNSLEDQQLLFNVQTDTEAAGTAPVNYSLVAVNAGESVPGWIGIDSSTGVITGNPDNTMVGEYHFTIRAQSSEGDQDQAFSLTIDNADPLFLNHETAFTFTETSGNQTFDVQNNDEGMIASGHHPYDITSVTFNSVAISQPSWLTIDHDSGLMTGNPLSDDVGTYVISVQFDDGNLAANSVTHQDFTLTVENIDNFFTSSPATIWTEDASNPDFDVNTHEEGAGSGYSVHYSLIGAPSWVVFRDTGTQTGSLDGVLMQNDVVDNSLVGDHVFTIRSYEGPDQLNPINVVDQTFTLTVANVAPEIVTATTISIQEDTAAGTYTLSLDSPEPNNAGHPAVTWSIDHAPTIGGVPITITKIDDQHAELSFASPKNVDVDGIYVFNVTVTDGNGGVANKYFQLEITNKVPQFTELPDPTNDPHVIDINEDSSYSVDINVASPVNPVNDEGDGPTTYGLVGAPSFVSIDSATGLLSLNNPDNTQVGAHTFQVSLNDGHGGIAYAWFQVVVHNVAPILPPTGSATWYEDGDTNQDGTPDGEGWQTAVAAGVAGDVTDIGQGAVFSLDGAPSWLTIDAATGRMSYVPSNAEVGAHTFTVHLDDTHGGTADQTFTLEVKNSPPAFDGLYDSGATTTLYVNPSSGVQTFDFQTTDESSDRMIYGLTPNNQYSLISAYGWISLKPADIKTGQLTVDPTQSGIILDHPYTVTIQFSDGSTTVDKLVTVVVTNTPPAGTDPGNFDAGFYSPNNTSFIEDTGNQTFNIQYSTEGTNGALRYELIGAPSWLVFQDTGTQTGSSTGVITGNPTNVQTTDVNPGTPYTLQIHVYDGGSLDVTGNFELSVTNNPPLFDQAPFNVVFTEDVSYTPATTPYDVHTTDEPYNNALYPNSYSLAEIDASHPVPSWLKIDADTGKIYVDKGGSDPNPNTFVNDDDFGPAGGYDVKVVFNDAHGGVIERVINVSIENQLHFTDPGHHYEVVWQEDRESPFNSVIFEAATDDDPSSSRHVTYSLTNLPLWLIDRSDPSNPIPMIEIDQDTGVVTMAPGYENFVPDNTVPGTYHFTIVANDTHGTATHDVTLTVPNRDPHFAQTSFTMQEDLGPDTVNLQVDDEDQGTDHWYYTWSGAPQWMIMDPFTGVITADPTNQHVGTYTFSVTAYDLNAGKDAGYSVTEAGTYGDDPNGDGIKGYTTETITIEVLNRAPVFDTAAAATATEDAAFTFDVHQDDEGDGGTHYSLVGAPSWLTIDSLTGVITGTPDNADVGPDSPGVLTFTIRADDANAVDHITDQTFTLTVNNRLSYFTNGNNGTSNSYFFHLTEDAASVSFDLTSEDEGRHVSGGGTTQAGAVYYYLDPSVAPPGVRFVADGTSWQIADPDQPGLYLSSITGKMQLSPTNSDVYGNYLPGIDFQVMVFDGHTDASSNPTYTTADFTFAIDNTDPVFQTPIELIWVEDHAVPVADIDNTDEPYPRYKTDASNPQIYYELVNAPTWLRINNLFPDDPANTYHRELGQLYVADAYTKNTDGTPDNNLVGDYYFEVRFFDGTVWVQQAQPFHLQITNDPTDITAMPGDQHLVEDTTMTITEGEIQAKDEYGPTYTAPGYPQDYYVLYIDWENQDGLNNSPGSWLTVAQYNAMNDAWDPTAGHTANDITFDSKTGAITWTPNNGDVPNDDDSSGQYRHELIVVHHDGGANGYSERTTDTDGFFVYVDNVAPTLSVPPVVENAILTEDVQYHVLPVDVSSDEEGQSLTYVLTMEVDGVTEIVTTGFRPYGTSGTSFTFNENTGEIIWTPTNRDVSYDPTGTQTPYHLQLWADDGNADGSNPNHNLSLVKDLYWTVQEAPTTITSSPPDHGTATEGTAYTWNIAATDERSDRTGTHPVDTRYTLQVFFDGSYQNYTAYNTAHSTMGQVTFNTKNGQFSWTPNDLDAIAYHTDALPFRVVHNDANGDTDTKDFDLKVNNTAPVFQTPLPPATWVLYEDDNTTVPGYTNWIDIKTDDESQGGVTYSLTVAKGADTYTLGTDASDQYDVSHPEMLRHKINGDDGGYIILNTETGVITWATTNADVTNSISDSLLTPFGLYRFSVTATDHYNSSSRSFDVKVFNTATDITPSIGNQTLTEDAPQWKLTDAQVYAIDEETEATGANSRDAYYQLWVDGHQVVPDDPETVAPGQIWFHYTPNEEYDIDADHHVQSGATIYVNKDTGEIRWIDAGDNPLDDPNAYPSELGPNNRDVLDGHAYQFQLRHNDGNLSYDDDFFTVTVGNDVASLNDLTNWNLLEDHTNPSTPYDPYVYDPGLVTSDDENYGLTYHLLVDGNVVNSGDRINGPDGGQIFFDQYTGKITWLTTNADVTRHEDSANPGTFVGERSPYVFTIVADDGNTSTSPDQRAAKSFSVTVSNDPTSIGLENAGDHYNPDALPATVTIDEDVLWNTFNVGSRDENVETDASTPPGAPWQDSYYELLVTHNSTDYWVVQETDPTKYDPTTHTYTGAFNTGGADLTFNKEDGQFSWTPNDSDVGSYTFTVIHHDGHESTATGVFTVTVNNKAPDFEAPTPTGEELFVEDSTSGPDFSFTVRTDDQNQGGVTYTVAFGVGTDAATATYDTVYDSSHTTGLIPNMDVGGIDQVGLISFDPVTKIVTWHTSNADVNWDGTDYLGPNQNYFFRVTATDHHGAESLTSTHTFEAKVQETKTEIDQVVYTDVSNPSNTITTAIPVNPADPAVVINQLEDQGITIDFHANDEEQETGDASFIRDSYYILTVSGPDGAGGTVTHGFTYLGDHAVQSWQQAGLGLFDGGTMTFNPDTGLVSWIPNDRDVGTWTFTATHYDGQGTNDPVTVQVNVGNTDPDLTIPASWVFQEYPINAQDAASHALVPGDWLITQDQVWSDDEGLRVGFTYSLEVTDSGGTVHAVNQAIPAGIDHTGDADWVGAQINGTDGGWLLLNLRTGQIEWKTSNADVTRGFNNEDLGRNPYTFDLKATDPSNGESAVKAMSVDVLNRDTGIIVSTIDDSQVTEHTLRSFNIDALDEQVERTGLDTTYLLQVHIDTDNDGNLEWIDVDDYNSTYLGGRAPVTFSEEPAGPIPAGYFAWTPNDLDSIAGQLEFRVYHNDGNLSVPHYDFILSLGNKTPVFTSFPDSDPTNPVILTEDAFENGLPADQYTIFDAQIQTNEELAGVTYSLDVTTSAGTTIHVNNSIPVGVDHFGDSDWVGAQVNGGGGWVLLNTLTGETEWKTTNADVTVDTGAAIDPANGYTFSVTADDHTTNGPEPPTATRSFTVQVRNDPTDILTDVPNQTFEQGVPWQLGDNEVVDRDERVGAGTYYTLMVAREGDAPVDVTAYNTRVTQPGADGTPIAFDPLTGATSWADSTNRDVGLYHFEIIHHDGHNTTDSDTFDVTIVNKVPQWTTAAPGGQVVMATKGFTYDAGTNEEGQNDWRGDDATRYSIVQGPSDMTIDPDTGFVIWTADPKLAGPVTITIEMEDGNGGVIFQTFTIIVDVTRGDLPIEMRPDFQGYNSHVPQQESWNPGPAHEPEYRFLLDNSPLPIPEGHIVEEILKKGAGTFEDLLAGLDGYDLKQPSLDKPGSISPITPLSGYPDPVAHGDRLNFSAEEIALWDDLHQPSLDIGGSQSPDTPLEGFGPAVEAGKRLNFDYFPIREAVSLKLDDLTVGNLLGLY